MASLALNAIEERLEAGNQLRCHLRLDRAANRPIGTHGRVHVVDHEFAIDFAIVAYRHTGERRGEQAGGGPDSDRGVGGSAVPGERVRGQLEPHRPAGIARAMGFAQHDDLRRDAATAYFEHAQRPEPR